MSNGMNGAKGGLRGWGRRIMAFCRAKPLGAAGALILLAFIVIALLAPFISPYDPNEQVLTDRLQAPSFTHLMGTDDYGRDVYSRIIWGSRTSLYVSLLSITLGAIIGTLIGLSCGYFGGKYDMIMQRIMDSLMAIPGLVLAMVLMAALGTNMNNVVLALAIISIPAQARIVRGTTLAIKDSPFIEAAHAIGSRDLRIQLVHILPNVTAPIIIMATSGLGQVILVESSLSFLGLGVPPPEPSWGRMLSGSARTYMETAPWLVIFPGVAISLAVLGFNLFGDALRDWWDPKLRGSRGMRMVVGKVRLPLRKLPKISRKPPVGEGACKD